MAFSSMHDVTRHHHGHLHHLPPDHLHYPSPELLRVEEDEKHFRPNPDAKPFIPNIHAFTPSWHFYRNENAKNMNGVPVFVNPQLDSDVMFTNFSPNSSKKHIAFHLVSNVLDDEVVEESGHLSADGGSYQTNNVLTKMHPPTAQTLPPQDQPLYTNMGNSWRSGASSNFTLPLGVERSMTEKSSSINNKSIHEIWSPDPSPNDLSNLSPNDEVIHTMNNDNLHAETHSLYESLEIPDTTLEYRDRMKEENGYCYPHSYPLSHVYPHYSYRSNQEIYSPKHFRAHNPVYVNNYYSQYIHRNFGLSKMICEQCGYPSCKHFVNRAKTRKYGDANSLHGMYDLKVSFLEKLGISLDACCDQLRHLDRDSRKADVTLSKTCRLRKSSSSDCAPCKYPNNSTRVDKLIIDQEKEHQKVESLIGRIERQGFTPMHPNVGVTLDLWLTAIKDLRNIRRNELASVGEDEFNSGKSHSESDMRRLIDAVYKLTKHTRHARTVVWCAMQIFRASTFSARELHEVDT